MVQKNEFLAYEGENFSIEWYFTENQESQPFAYYCELRGRQRIKVLRLFKRMGDAGEIKNKTLFVNEGDKIYAFKPKPDRFLCFFFENKKIIVTNAFKKMAQKLPRNENENENEKALNFRSDYLKRLKTGEYYE
jgi:hypothetical protein